MAPLAQQVNFRSLSLRDLLDARNTYRRHLMNKANVVGTAAGVHLVRDGNVARHDPRTPRRRCCGRRRSSGAARRWPVPAG